MEGKIMERPRVPYSEIFNTIDGHKDISYEDRVQVKAIDLMMDALLPEGDIEKAFSGRTLGNPARLTDPKDPNYKKDLLWGIHTPEEFLHAIDRDAVSVHIDEYGHVVDSGLIQRWGERLRLLVEPVDGEQPDEVEAKKLVRDVLDKNEDIFRFTPAGVTVLV